MDSNNEFGTSADGPVAETSDTASPAPARGEKNTVVLSADHFPAGITPKDGEKLTFCVTGSPDSEGNVSGYFEAGGEAGAGMNDWEQDFKASMSPQSKQEAPE